MKKGFKFCICISALMCFIVPKNSFATDELFSGTIQNDIFTNLSIVLNNETTNISTSNTNLVKEVKIDSISLQYNRDRNNSTLTLPISLEDKNIGITKSNVILNLNKLEDDLLKKLNIVNASPDDRLVKNYFYNENGSNKNIEIVLKENVSVSYEIGEKSTKIRFTKNKRNNPIVVLDPGHGGKDPGTTSKTTKVTEKELTLRTGKLLEEKLLSSGYSVHMTRSEDVYPTLLDRAKLANELDADLFISLHYNSAEPKTYVNGIETFAYFTEDNKKIGTFVHNELISNTGANNRGLKTGNKLVVLNKTKVPAILLELGFLSNPKEATLVLEESYQEILANSILNGINLYFEK